MKRSLLPLALVCALGLHPIMSLMKNPTLVVGAPSLVVDSQRLALRELVTELLALVLDLDLLVSILPSSLKIVASYPLSEVDNQHDLPLHCDWLQLYMSDHSLL